MPEEAQNALLKALPRSDHEALIAASETIDLPLNQVLHEPGDEAEFVYFPLTSVISLLTVLQDGSAVEVASAGSEGMVNLSAYTDTRSPARWVVQVPGRALRVDAKQVRLVAEDSSAFRSVMHAYLMAMFILVSQTAACNRRHSVEERCARWLLMTHDRVAADRFLMTHELLADMLGVRRPSVSIAMSGLSRAGFIRYTRGRIAVLDRGGLEGVACECYRVIATQFQQRIRANE